MICETKYPANTIVNIYFFNFKISDSAIFFVKPYFVEGVNLAFSEISQRPMTERG